MPPCVRATTGQRRAGDRAGPGHAPHGGHVARVRAGAARCGHDVLRVARGRGRHMGE